MHVRLRTFRWTLLLRLVLGDGLQNYDRRFPLIKMAGRLWKNSAGMMILYAENCRYASATERVRRNNDKLSNLGPLEPISRSAKGDFQILFVQRSEQSRFMADTHVFPGGKMEQVDYSPRWKDLYNSIVPSQPFDSILKWLVPHWSQEHKRKRLPIYDSIPREGIPGEIALRICAIRETFEESGILFARPGKDAPLMAGPLDQAGTMQPSLVSLPDLEQWRHRVHQSADEFLSMCREFHFVPDVWSLIEWSNWLTPENLHRRYDTVFYLCCINERPSATPENKEITKAEWLSPMGALEGMMKGTLRLPYPQLSEIHLMNLFPDLPCLHSFALKQALTKQPHRRLSMRMKHEDKFLMVLNGDDLYPRDCDPECVQEEGQVAYCVGEQFRDRVTLVRIKHGMYEYKITGDVTYEELLAKSANKKRLIVHKPSLDGWEYMDTVEIPHAAQFIQDYSSLVPELTSKL